MAGLALYTTIYPGVERYLAGWYRTVVAQTDRDFDLWIGLDALPVEMAVRAMSGDNGATVEATWIPAASGDTPAQVRQRALEKICAAYDTVVLVDSDDLLLPDRVAGAREMLRDADLAGCALRLVDQGGRDLGLTFELPPALTPEQVFPRHNVFGLSNSAYRCDLLARCLPVPADAELVDWYLAGRAWLLGARMAFTNIIGMEYRQHAANMVRTAPPFAAGQVGKDTERVLHHARLLQGPLPEGARPDRAAALREWALEVEFFYERVVLRPGVLERYVKALNTTEVPPLWWSCVAHPSLRHMWEPT